jgi:sugar O-acyltransferase (sialic acid O-acetyltransferase NeuD family)
MKDLAIVGTGGMAREARQIVDDINDDAACWNLLGFIDDRPGLAGSVVDDLQVLGTRTWLLEHPSVAYVAAVGKPADRWRFDRLVAGATGNEPVSLIHPTACVGRRVEVGEGTIVAQGTVLTTDIRIGGRVILNVGVTIAHDDDLGDFATLAPGVHLAGAVNVGEGADIGIGSRVIQGLTVGPWSVIGAEAAVIADVPANATVVGVPARVIKERPFGWHEVPG